MAGITKPTCTHTELLSRLVALEVAHISLEKLLMERDRRYAERAMGQDASVISALATSKEAVLKAETATERRLEGLNELRGLAGDQAKSFARADEVRLMQLAVDKRLDDLTAMVTQYGDRGRGMKDAWGYVVAMAGIGVALIVGWLFR